MRNKQLSLDLKTWVFTLFKQDSQNVVERRYSNGTETLRLFWRKGTPDWVDIRNRVWKVIGPGWGQPVLHLNEGN